MNTEENSISSCGSVKAEQIDFAIRYLKQKSSVKLRVLCASVVNNAKPLKFLSCCQIFHTFKENTYIWLTNQNQPCHARHQIDTVTDHTASLSASARRTA